MSKMRSFASLPPVRSCRESDDQSAARTMCLCLNSSSSSPVSASHTLAEKSPETVAHLVASGLSAAPHTAPLCPSKVPIQSPVSPDRIIAVLSWHAESRKTPSSVSLVNSMPAIGREWPGQMSGALACKMSDDIATQRPSIAELCRQENDNAEGESVNVNVCLCSLLVSFHC